MQRKAHQAGHIPMQQRTVLCIIMVIGLASQAVGDERRSLLNCGVTLGASQPTFNAASNPPSTPQNHRNTVRANRVVGAASADATFGTWHHTEAFHKTQRPEVRLPRKVTFATVGCSWL